MLNYKIGNVRQIFQKKIKNNGGICTECVGCCDMVRKKHKNLKTKEE